LRAEKESITMPTQPRKPPTPAEVLRDQTRRLENDKLRAANASAANLPAKTETKLPAVDNRSAREQYLAEIAPASLAGPRVGFSGKDGKYTRHDTDAEISETAIFIALVDQVHVGFVRFNGEGEAPTQVMGPLYDGFVPPPRESLGEMDQAKWEVGLNGQPQDPWVHQMWLVLQDAETSELLTFVTSSTTGRRAVGNLLRHYDRMVKTHADHYPLVNLKVGGFNHRDPRVGWVPVPVIAVIGRKPRDDAAAPDAAPQKADFQDSIPF
jgi:hypothetical protein